MLGRLAAVISWPTRQSNSFVNRRHLALTEELTSHTTKTSTFWETDKKSAPSGISEKPKKLAKNVHNRHPKNGMSHPGSFRPPIIPKTVLMTGPAATNSERRMGEKAFPRVWQTDILCPVTGHFVQLFGSSAMSSCEIFVGLVSEKWLFLNPPLRSAVQWRPRPHKGIAGFTF